ncbi:dTMP kinase [Salinisphaera sp.]|uniref:dTMP kinase n=1 Tax=Salinisphaera sp. TaxID=1914330 RepID=UPI000C59EE2A|nr:dTMP kinase [Salinisphaera sp.]MAS10119.1 dTMP kinase [Salinisphaera sp.]
MTEPVINTPRLIALEGGEGAGKSTQIETVAAILRGRGLDVVTSREPGGTRLGEAVRGVLMNEYDHPMPAMSELLLMFAARAAHLSQVIEPALARGAWVVTDRFTDASYAYQGAARGLGDAAVATLERLVQGERRPDGVLVFDIPVEAGLARAGKRGDGNRFDRETVAFHERVRAAYLARAHAAPAHYRVIDAEASPAAVRRQIETALADWP